MSTIRNYLYDTLKREVVGPNQKEPYIDKNTGEEVLLEYVHGTPLKRYGAAILYPQPTRSNSSGEGANSVFDGSESGCIQTVDNNEKTEQNVGVENDFKEGRGGSVDAEPLEDDPISFANALKPSTIGFTFRISSKFTSFQLNFDGGIYSKADDNFCQYQINRETKKLEKRETGQSPYWKRKKINFEAEILKEDISRRQTTYSKIIKIEDDVNWLKLNITNRTTRTDIDEGFFTLTVSVINTKCQSGQYPVNDDCIFQSCAEIKSKYLVPFDEKKTKDAEVEMLNLLYREKRGFAIGHGIGVEWEDDLNPSWIRTNALPNYEIPKVEPAGDVTLSMYDLSDKGDWDKATKTLDELVTKYEQWIEEEKSKIDSLEKRYQEAAENNIQECCKSLKRIVKGISLLKNDQDGKIIASFSFMNRAMLWQQQRSKIKQRKWIKKGNRVDTLEEAGDKDLVSLFEFQKEKFKGEWRPFQLAFILMNLESIVNPESKEREIVELIWFPTGGGKTEAYLGVAAFTIFWKRMRIKNSPEQTGTTMLMRYTLRLLTTQQFERASSMIVACDIIVRDYENFKYFGDPEPVSIGLWVGSANTPNKIDNARSQFQSLISDNDAKYNFIILKCPCCGAQVGKLDEKQKTRNIKIKSVFKKDGTNGSVYFRCENESCETSGSLPVYVVDEDIYEKTPDLVLATVDKLAMVPFKKEAGRLFGFRENDAKEGYRIQPPELIIQDELHLISGPLGSMVGLYETMVQTLCNNYKTEGRKLFPEQIVNFIPAKIIASTATISRAKEQVKCLYAKDNLHIFPSQGLEFGNSWFSKEVKPSDKDFGRKYIGICPSGYPSAQTAIVRSYAAVLQGVMNLTENNGFVNLDYYWTLVGYFNSIRELGGAVTLAQADIIERLNSINKRDLNKKRRTFLNPIELTSRVDSSEIPQFLKKLEVEKDEDSYAKDLCLATNMIATGVDISRFGLMFVHGQPKTTAEYIQASSRVGRDSKGPGIVFTLFNPNKPRDKSQYEQFQTYHSRIYSSVEPTSVTPFSIVARDRALHAVAVGLIRNFSNDSLRDNPITVNTDFESITKFVREIILDRVNKINPKDSFNVAEEYDTFIKKWAVEMGYSQYGDAGNQTINKGETTPMLYSNTGEVRDSSKKRDSNATPTSMRGVDTETKIELFS
jgi:hypothetical protein